MIEGPIDGESFRTYVERVLVPTLRPGDIVVLDNFGSAVGSFMLVDELAQREQDLDGLQAKIPSPLRS